MNSDFSPLLRAESLLSAILRWARWAFTVAGVCAVVLLMLAFLVGCGGGGGGGGGGGFAAVAAPAPQPAPAAQAPADPPKQPAAECSVTLYGDSIMVGAVAKFRHLRPAYRVEDKAVAGTKLMTLERSFNNDFRGARFVVIENGSIDAWNGSPPSLLASTLVQMAAYVKAEGRTAVLTGPSHVAQFAGSLLPTFGDAGRSVFEASLKAAVAQEGIAFADWGSVQFDGASDVPDGIHPGAAYSDRLALRLAETLDRLAPECKP